MGQRANSVIIRGGDWQLYYGKHSARYLDTELLWGPSVATGFVETEDPVIDRTDWLDEVWCEGGAIIDHDRHVLLWFGGEDIMFDVPQRQAFLALMQHLWAGWDIRWACGDIIELGAYLGFSADKFIVAGEPDPSEAFRLSTDNNMLLTVQQAECTTVTQITGDEESLELGEVQLQTLLDFPRTATLEWAREMPTGGLHINVDERRLHYWFAYPCAAIEDRVSRGWPAWRCEWLRDRFEAHVQLVAPAVRLPVRGSAELQREIVGRLRSSWIQIVKNPATELASRLGTGVETDPSTNEAPKSLGDAAAKHRILDELESMIPL